MFLTQSYDPCYIHCESFTLIIKNRSNWALPVFVSALPLSSMNNSLAFASSRLLFDESLLFLAIYFLKFVCRLLHCPN